MLLGLSATIIGASMDPGVLFGVLSGYGRSGGNYSWALGFGMATLFLIATTPVVLVGLKGAAIIQRAAVNGLSLAEAEEEIARKVNEMKKRTQDAREQVKARTVAAQAQEQASASSSPQTESAAVQELPQDPLTPMVCPRCSACIGESDLFCGSCGHKLE